jgi:hypothetical protein
MKNHEWKAMGRVIYGSRKNCILRGEKGKFCGRIELYDASSKSRLCRVTGLLMNDPGKLMELAVVFLVCPHFVRIGKHATQSSA